MKIAISTDSGKVSEHFGRCPEFTIVEIKNNKVEDRKIIFNPGHITSFLPKFFKEKGVNCVIIGGAGLKAKKHFEQFGIKLIIGIQGEVNDFIKGFIKGEIKQGKDFYKPGKGKGYGIKKKESHE